MANIANVQKTYALILGVVLGIIGIWGFFTTSILGLFGVNAFQSVLHLIAAAFGIYVGTKGKGPGFNQSIGWIGVVLGILGFISGANTLLFNLLNINAPISVLHLVLGVISLGVYYGVKE